MIVDTARYNVDLVDTIDNADIQVKKRATNVLLLYSCENSDLPQKINLHFITCSFMTVNKLYFTKTFSLQLSLESLRSKVYSVLPKFCCWIMQIRKYSTNWIPLCNHHDKISRSQRLCIRFYCKNIRTEAREQEER